jgi:tetratricopeptide (TPR) repeat protein
MWRCSSGHTIRKKSLPQCFVRSCPPSPPLLHEPIYRSDRSENLIPVANAYKELLKTQPSNPNFLFGRGYSLLKIETSSRTANRLQTDNYREQENRIRESFESIKKASELAPQEAEPIFALGQWQSYFGEDGNGFKRRQNAQAIIKKGLKLEPKSSIGHVAYGLEFPRQKDALPYYRNAVKLDPQSEEAHALLAMSLMEIGRTDEARREWLEYEKAVPKSILQKDTTLRKLRQWILGTSAKR